MTDLHRIAIALQQLFPGAEPITPLKQLGRGFSSVAIETASGYVFRVGLSPDARAASVDTMHLLKCVSSHVTLDVPQIAFALTESDSFPFGVVGYRKLPGEPLDLVDFTSAAQAHVFASQIGTFLAQLHQMDIQDLRSIIDLEKRRQQWLQWRDDAFHVLPAMLPADAFHKIVYWWDLLLSDPVMDTFPAAVVHGDPWYGNFLVRDQRIVGVLDFEQAGVNDAAVDFAAQLYCGRAFLDSVIRAYTATGGKLDQHWSYRTAQHLVLREFSGLSAALAQGMNQEVMEAQEKLLRSPLFSTDGLGDWPVPWC